MRAITVSINIAPPTLAGAVPATGRSNSLDPQVQLVAHGSSTADRHSYARNARNEKREWQRKLRSLGKTVKVEKHEAGAAADSD